MTKHIIAISILLLSLSTQLSAQNRSERETLGGLPAIGVIVKYANADEMNIVMQQNTVEALQDRARKLMNSQLDVFIKAFTAANPKLASLPNAKAQ